MTRLMQDILKLSVSERILMVEAIWDSIAENDENLELTDDIKNLLNHRIEIHKNTPTKGADWTEVKKRIKKQL